MSKKKYIICQGLFLSLFALIMIINFIRDGYGIYPDSDSYITFDLSREPLYPLLLGLFRIIFGSKLNLWFVAGFESLLALYSCYYFASTMVKKFDLHLFSLIGIDIVLVAYFYLPRFFSISHLNSHLAILTEGIMYPLYLIWFSLLVQTIIDKTVKKWIEILAITAVMVFTRSAMLPLLIVDFVLVICVICSIENHKIQKCVYAGLLCLFTVAFLNVMEHLYFKVLTNEWMKHTYGAVTAMSDVLLLAKEEDAEVFTDNEIRTVFLDTYHYMESYGLTYEDVEDTGLFPEAVHMEYCHDPIKFDCYEKALEIYFQSNPTENWTKRVIERDRIASEITNKLRFLHIGQYFKCYFGNCVRGYVRTIATHPDNIFMVIYSIIMFVFSLFSFAFCKDKEVRLFLFFVWLSIAAVVCSVSLVIMCLQRYMLYNFPVFYTSIFVIVEQFYGEKAVLRLKERRP